MVMLKSKLKPVQILWVTLAIQIAVMSPVLIFAASLEFKNHKLFEQSGLDKTIESHIKADIQNERDIEKLRSLTLRLEEYREDHAETMRIILKYISRTLWALCLGFFIFAWLTARTIHTFRTENSKKESLVP